MDTSNNDSTDLAPRAADAPALPPPQYMTGFDGMATEPFPAPIRTILAEHVPPEAVEIKPNGIVFVPGVFYRRQLTKAFGAGGWAIVPRGPSRVMGDLVVYPGALYCHGRFVAEAVGECTYRQNSNMSYASCVEGAKTDALSRCCKDLGMATELWDAAWRDQWMSSYAEKGSDGKWRARSGRPVQDIDLMAGAGGVAPKEPAPSAKASKPAATTTPAPAAAPAKEAAQAAPKATPAPTEESAKPASASPEATSTATTSAKVKSEEPSRKSPSEPAAAAAGVPSAATPTTTDTGEAATPKQLEDIANEIRSFGWKRGYVRLWLEKFTETCGWGKLSAITSLSQKQADGVLAALVSLPPVEASK